MARYSLIVMILTLAVAAAMDGIGSNLDSMLVSANTPHHAAQAAADSLN